MARSPKSSKRILSDVKVKDEPDTTPEPDPRLKASPKLPSASISAKDIDSSALLKSHVPVVRPDLLHL